MRSTFRTAQDMIDELLNSLLARLQCAHIVVHAPSWFADLVVPPAAEGETEGIDSLTRQLLWSMAREDGKPKILNRMRLKHGGPVLPYRVIFCPLIGGGKTVGLIAAIRKQAAFRSPNESLAKRAHSRVGERNALPHRD